jgi:hypothetical protein
MLEYVFGFLTAINMGRDENHQIQNHNESIELSLRNYCMRHPIDRPECSECVRPPDARHAAQVEELNECESFGHAVTSTLQAGIEDRTIATQLGNSSIRSSRYNIGYEV